MGLIFFIFATIFAFTIPGNYLLSYTKAELDYWERITLGTILGFVLFTTVSYLLLTLNLHLFLIPLIVLVNILFLKKFISKKISIVNPGKNFLILLFLFVVGIIGQLAIIAPSGITQNGDLLFWSSNGHDGTWHIALAEEIKKGYPFQNPVLAGERLVNYHFFSDISLSDFNKLFQLSLIDLYFRFFPFLFSILLGGSAFILGRRLGGTISSGIWSVIFTYFAGSFGYIVTYLRDGTIRGESLFWASQIQSSSGNPPQIASDFLLLGFLCLFFLYLQKKSWMLFVSCLLVAGSLILFKVYAAMAILGSLGLVGTWQIIRERNFYIFGLFILSSLLSALIYLPNSAGAGSFLIFEPWWYIRTMVVIDSRLDWIDLERRRQTYIAEDNLKRVIQLEVTAFLIFFFGNLGMRFLGLIDFLKAVANSFKNYFSLTLVSITLVSLVFPLLFLQKGVAGNTSQFFQYFLLIFGIFAGISTSKLLSKIRNMGIKVTLASIIIALAIPTQLGLLEEFYSRPAFAKISKSEIDALTFLKNNSSPNSVILTPPYNKDLDFKQVPPHIWDWFDTSYVSALSGRRTYFADYEQVDIMGYDYERRLNIVKQFFYSENQFEISNLTKEGVNYIYFPKRLVPKYIPIGKFTIVYQNKDVEIWEITL